MVAFNTPQNERSFSGLVDDVVLATGKPGAVRNIVGYVNATIRECQARGFFWRDLIEDQLPAISSTPVTWDRPPNFRSLKTIYYTTQDVYPPLLTPGKRQQGEMWFYYGADDYFVFKGPLLGEDVNLAYYLWAAPLMYYQRAGENSSSYPGGPYLIRPAYFDIIKGKWQYYISTATPPAYADTTGVPATDLAQQVLVSNWLIRDWYETIVEGAKAKTYAAYGDPRNQLSYALYTNMRETLKNAQGREGDDND